MDPQLIVFGTLFVALVLFVTGRPRYDVVALLALMTVTITGIIPQEDAFNGFGHPAVITVAAVLVISRALLNAGVVDLIARQMKNAGENITVQLGVLLMVATVSSAFMNNVGALALLMPVAIHMARKSERSASIYLMPLAFGSLLGGLTTLIGTPPNIIIANFRPETGAPPFRMFDFAPVGLGIAVAGGLFITLIGWRLVPQRKGESSRANMFEIEDYLTELRVPEDSELVGKLLRDIKSVADADAVVLTLIRNGRQLPAPSSFEIIRASDILIVEADSDDLKELINAAQLELVGSKEEDEEKELSSDEISTVEAVITPASMMIDRTAHGMNLRWRHGVSLLAVARQGERVKQRLGRIRFRPGDVLLLHGRTETLQDALPVLGCLPLAEREFQFGRPRRLLMAVGLFGLGLITVTTGMLSIQIALIGVVILMLVAGLLSLKEAYESIDWSVIVLLGAMIPVGQALEITGGAQSIADALLVLGGQLSPVATLTLLLVGTMFLSDLVNNAAAAVLMAPIAISVANGLGAAADPFLMAVAVGASCAFLTPIGHQSNTLVMGPGGYRFGDYWRMGLPLEVIIVVVGIPLILLVWPLGV
jgi:di/tricarboxylate transporter